MDEALRLIEYQELKAEQRTRMEIRDKLVYLTFVALGASVWGGYNNHQPVVFLVVPLVCIALGWIYLRNNEKVSSLGRYLAVSVGAGWETHRVGIKGRRRRKIIQLAVDYMVFIFTGYMALGLFWSSPLDDGALGIISLVEAFTLLGLAVEFGLAADILFPSPKEER
jgi:TRAP-type C4-dicarboxylate transport system permease small subunit